MTLKDSSEKTDVHNLELVLSDSFSFFHITAKSFGRKETWASQMAQWWRICLPTPEERQVQCLGWEDLLEKAMGTYCSILAWIIPWTEEPGGLQSVGSQRVGRYLGIKEQQQGKKYINSSPPPHPRHLFLSPQKESLGVGFFLSLHVCHFPHVEK